MTKNFLLSILVIFMMTGCEKYVEPKSVANVGSIIIAEYPKLCNGDGIDTRLEINEKSAYPERVVTILPGKQKITLEITAYFNHRAKYGGFHQLDMIIKPKHQYIIKVKTDKKILLSSEIEDNVNAEYIVYENKKVIMKKKFILEDNLMRSTSPVNGTIDPMVLDSIVYSAMLSAGI